MIRFRAATAAVLGMMVVGCEGGAPPASQADTGETPAAQDPAAEVFTVAERWVSEADTAWDVDTPDLWVGDERGLVLVTGKATHDLRVFDGATGETLEPIGSAGSGAGEFLRPNGVLVVEDFALVVERDNRRVQVLEMPEATPLGSFGADVLEYPYGIAAIGTPDSLTLWVTDDYEYEEDVVPDDLTHRVHRFDVRLANGTAPTVLAHTTFGAADGAGSLRVVESIQVDSARGRLFIADESRKSYMAYALHGQYLGGAALGAGMIEGDPEGIVLVECSDGGGYWIVTDQQDTVSLFRLFDRSSLDYVGTFRGPVTANTDGASFEHGPVPGFPNGVLYAVHDDQALSAFDWADVASAMGLPSGCGVR